MEPEIGLLYESNKKQFECVAKRWTWRYAMHDALFPEPTPPVPRPLPSCGPSSQVRQEEGRMKRGREVREKGDRALKRDGGSKNEGRIEKCGREEKSIEEGDGGSEDKGSKERRELGHGTRWRE